MSRTTPSTDPSAFDHLLGVPVVHHHLPRTWGTQHVVTAGPDDAEAMVLLHGWPQHWLAWRRVVAPLAARRRVVLVDLRGFGWSDAHQVHGTQVADLVGDVLAAMDDLGVGRAHLVGHDWGGWVGFRAVLDRPGRFRRHHALAVVPPWLDGRAMLRHLARWAYVVPMALAGDRIARRPRLVASLVERTTTAPVWADAHGREALGSFTARAAAGASPAMTRRLYRLLLGTELPAAVRRPPEPVVVPTTVLVGEHEPISAPALWWHRSPELAVRVLPGAGHWLAEEVPDDVVHHLVAGGSEEAGAQMAGEGPALDA